MFRVKICGVTNPADAQIAARAGADAIGLNFYAGSKRYVEPSVARGITESTPSDLMSVGVFVNASADQIARVVDEAHLDAVQLHGDEPPALLAELAGLPVVRACRPGAGALGSLAATVEACQLAGRRPDALLVDAAVPGAYGGSGHTVAWDELIDHRDRLAGVPLLLAGGLTADNVADAIRVVQPAGVDVASGVESAPGKKDAELVDRFVSAALAVLA